MKIDKNNKFLLKLYVTVKDKGDNNINNINYLIETYERKYFVMPWNNIVILCKN